MDFTYFFHLQSWKLHAKAYGWSCEKLKQELEEARELYSQTQAVTIRLASHKSGKVQPDANYWMAGFRQRGDEQITIAGHAAHQNLQKNNMLWKVPQALCFLHLSNATTSWRFSLAACVSFAPHTVFSSAPPVRTVSQVEMHCYRLACSCSRVYGK